MKVITGTAKGRVLKTLDGLETRPTTQRVKEALFSVLQFDIEGRRVLDLFAGSGQLGIEALSRGAKSAVFIDSSKKAVSVIKENLLKTGFSSCSKVYCSESIQFLTLNSDTYDIVFIDPPYGRGLAEKTLYSIDGLLCAGSVAVCEHDVHDILPNTVGTLEMFQKKQYGRICITFYRKRSGRLE